MPIAACTTAPGPSPASSSAARAAATTASATASALRPRLGTSRRVTISPARSATAIRSQARPMSMPSTCPAVGSGS
ncbi:hypothetical protein P3T34_006958 [Kitasatospora sp. MAP12-44]|nr:hypothetical protein [Kitasatospora sp. MAP12-44]